MYSNIKCRTWWNIGGLAKDKLCSITASWTKICLNSATCTLAERSRRRDVFSLPLLAGQIQRPDTLHRASVLCRVPVSSHQLCMCSFPWKSRNLIHTSPVGSLSHFSPTYLWYEISWVKNLHREWVISPKWKLMKLTGFQKESLCQQGHKRSPHT